MSPKSVLKKIRTVWGPKMRRPVGSLDDIVVEEEARLRKLAEGLKDIPESPGLGNKIYTQHTMVVATVEDFKLASNDFIYMMKDNQAGMYASMSTWVGRPEDPDSRITAQIIHLKGISFSESLNNFRLVLEHLDRVNSEGTRKLISNQFAPVYEGLSKLLRKMDRMAGMMQYHLSEITPIMIQYSKKDLPFLRKQKQDCTTDKEKPLIYDPHFESIVSEKSLSVMDMTPSTAEAAELFRPPFLSRAFYTIVRMLTCSNKNATRFIRAPILGTNQNEVTNDDDFLDFDLREIKEQHLEQDAESFTVITENQQFAPQTNSFCVMNVEVRDALVRRGVSMPLVASSHDLIPLEPHHGDEDSAVVNSGEGSACVVRLLSLDPAPNNIPAGPTSGVYGVVPKAVQELTKEDILLANTHEFAILHESAGVINSDSSTSDFSDKDKTEVFATMSVHSYTFPEDPLSYLLHRVAEVKNIISTISEMVREMEENLYALPYDKLKVDPDDCVGFDDLLRTIKEKAKLLDVIADFRIYLEEEITLVDGVRSVYLEALKCTELFQSFARMLKVDQDLLFQILRDFHAEEVAELRPMLAAHNEALYELKRCPPLDVEFLGVKLHTFPSLNPIGQEITVTI